MRKTSITIRRPEGHIETIDISDKFPGGISNSMFEQIKSANTKAGKGECLSYDIQNIDIRTDAEKDHDKMIGKALSELYNAEHADYYDPARVIKAKSALDDANTCWKEKYLKEAAEMEAKNKADEAAKKQEIRNSAGYIAAIEGRD